MTPLAEILSIRRPLLGRIVQDRTGLAGPYNIELEFDFKAANRSDYSGPSIFTALKEQLGVRLEAAKGPLEVIVVDGVSTPGENYREGPCRGNGAEREPFYFLFRLDKQRSFDRNRALCREAPANRNAAWMAGFLLSQHSTCNEK